MQFKKIFRGYDPAQVDKYIAETADRESATRRAQRERIDELSEENYNLRERIVELQRKQNDISEAMITAQKVANDIERNAKDNSDKALLQAKKFYATWQAYAKTIVATFTDDEIVAFNALQNKIGEVISDYENKLRDYNPSQDIDGSEAEPKRKVKISPSDFAKQMEETVEELSAKSQKLQSQVNSSAKPANPITRVEQAAGQTIDLRELVRPTQSLEEICADLGLIDNE